MKKGFIDNIPYTGRNVESDFFGEVRRKYFEQFVRESNEGGRDLQYVPFKEAVALIKRAQPWEDPSDPDKPFANDLHATIADKLRLKIDQGEYERLKFYTAVSGTHLDRFHGIDAFFEFEIADREQSRVTMDISLRDKDSWKANILIMIPEELDPGDRKDKDNRRSVMRLIDKISDQAVDIISNKIYNARVKVAFQQ